ncbi:hypothetical protein [Nostoc sp.]|uniref:hypothetical protein n=1 Tax=Nostoc sp. TaxID=1180 RepID=UPI00117D8243
MRYELRSNTTPVATTDSAGGKRVCERREPPQRTGSPTIPNFVQNQIVILYLLYGQSSSFFFLTVQDKELKMVELESSVNIVNYGRCQTPCYSKSHPQT